MKGLEKKTNPKIKHKKKKTTSQDTQGGSEPLIEEEFLKALDKVISKEKPPDERKPKTSG